jgi:alkylhydroperoxidase family enzyme
MSILRTIPEADADATTAALYDDDIADQGFVAAHTKVMALNPEAYAAWEALIGAIARPLGKRRYELVTLAAARGTRSRHCRLAHGRKSLGLFSEDQLVRIAADYRDAGLSPAEVAMMAFAERVGRDSDRMTEHGFSDQEILDIALAAAARNYYSRALQALAVEVDVPEDIGPELRDALVRDL